MSTPNAVTSGASAAPRTSKPASTGSADSADGSALDFAALLMGLGAEEELDGKETRALKSDEGATGTTALDTNAQALPTTQPQPVPPDAARPNEARGAEWAGAGTGAAVLGQVGAARAQAAGASDAATAADGVAALGEGRPGPGARKGAAQLPNLLKQAAYTQRMNAAQGGALDASGGASANTGGANARAATLAATAAAAARGDDIAGRLNPRGADALLATQVSAPTLTLTSISTTTMITPDAKLDARGQDRTPATADFGLAAAGALGASGAVTTQSVLSVAPDAGLTTQMHVAEQVSYWIGQGVQNAEVEVRGVAESPIQVSIDLQGVEARVAFHAEQPETRQVLQDAMPQLRELLEREGLVLSGVSVGVSGGEDQSQRQAKGQDEGRRVGRVRAAETVATPLPVARAHAGGSSGRSVDLFV
jgi:flagellar hook-length control protein FliK